MSDEPVCLDDIEALAGKNLNERSYAYFVSGAGEEDTLKENRQAFKRIKLRPRMLRGISHVDLRTSVLGHPISMPVCIAPVAVQKCAHPDGEIATVRAAAGQDIAMVLSMYGTSTFEEVTAASPQALKWFLIYILRDRHLFTSLVRRAENAGYQALVLNVDSPVVSGLVNRRCLKAGRVIGQPGDPSLALLEDNDDNEIVEHVISWESVDWVKSVTRLPVVLKGILTPEDARLAVEHGIDGIMVSNHGGRQLDGVLASIEALPAISEAVQGKLEIFMDGGVRLGTDVFKALALGARAVFIGRPVIWGLGYKGEAGVRKVLGLLREELRLAMILSGCGSLADITRSHVITGRASSQL
ncbi:2-Hydroxyacid oxidase 1 [Nematostella vectensis]|uniref:2-Hydroxyacid oxidase 1 n=1 Tax=Nematostella vectensis TaxID=45351 RepID=UPI0020775BA2|nr:2-Hydroxyacid oxidase 1 [Nematostella vectensis]